MARFSGKIQSVKFVDTSEKTIEILYCEPQTEDPYKLFSYYLEINYEDQNFLDLLEEISIEEIQDQTKKYHDRIIAQKQAWIEKAQAALDEQDKERYEIFEKYKEKQLSILQGELDAQVEERYHEADEYKEKQLKILQSEIDEQIEQRYKELDGYAESEIKKQKEEFLSKFNVPSPTRYTPEKVADYLVDNMNDEDMVFKTKLAVFNLPEVKNNLDREIKMKIRKAKSIPELFAVYNDIQYNHS